MAGWAKEVAWFGVGGELTGRIDMRACVLGRRKTVRGSDTLERAKARSMKTMARH